MSIFTKVDAGKVRLSNFNLSHEVKLSMNMGDAVPILCKEVLPKDTFHVSTELLIKMAPLAAPVMHRVKAYVHYFFVPMYQICNSFEKFINPKVNDGSIVLPYFTEDYASLIDEPGTLADYLGIPPDRIKAIEEGSNSFKLSALPFVAYQHIYNSYYRDQNLELTPEESGSSSLFDVDSFKNSEYSDISDMNLRSDVENLFVLRKRAWAKDYFTSALPSPQAGDDVILPISSQIVSDGPLKFNTEAGGIDEYTNLEVAPGSFDNGSNVVMDYNSSGYENLNYKAGLKLGEGSATINDLRKALALQRFKELAERGGTRYPEFVRNFFHAYLPDWYVDRPVFLGGNAQNINIGEVLQTSQTTTGDSGSAQGKRAGIASSYGSSKSFTLKSPCHGFLIGILSVRPEATYQQGIERMWTRETLFDYPFPQFANIGEQEIRNKEIFFQGTEADDGVFGYTPRYAEWKDSHSHVCGAFRDSLSYWHFGRIFSSLPTLSKSFVMMDNVPTRPFIVDNDSDEHLYVDLYNNIQARRPLPYFGTPSIL